MKREASGVVDVITAEDIGKFPDSNVAASLQRVPGVSIQRSGTRGEPTGITVRGFGGDFNETLYDGRRISTATGNRSVDFSTVGADFVGALTVMKTPDVTLSSSSIGATVNVAYPKPLDRPGMHFSASAAGSEQEEAGSIQPSAGLLFSDTFAGDTMGILVDAIYSKHETDANRVFVSGWEGGKFAPCQLTLPAVRRTGRREQDHRRLVAAAVRRRAIAGDRRASRWSHRVSVAAVGFHAAHHRRQFLAPEDRDEHFRFRSVVRHQRFAQRCPR
jgi:TonB-dependent receptor